MRLIALTLCLLLCSCALIREPITARWEPFEESAIVGFRLIAEDSRVLARVWRGNGDNSKTEAWGVYVNGVGVGDFIEIEKAKAVAVSQSERKYGLVITVSALRREHGD